MKIIIMKKIIISMFISTILIYSFLPFISFIYAAQDVEKQLVNFNLEKNDIIWEVRISLGIFAKSEIHPHDKYKFHIYSVDGVNKKYIVNMTYAPWTTGKWNDQYSFQESDYKLIKRDWYAAARNFAKEDANYWKTETELQQIYLIDYKDEFIMGKIINTVTISFYINESNYDIIKYTRPEGILIYRETKINSVNNKGQQIKGHFYINLIEYTGELEVSFWYWVLLIGIIAGIVFVSILITSILISRRQRRLKSINY